MRRIPNYGDLITVDEFLKAVESRSLMDYDGHGYWATVFEYDETVKVQPSTVGLSYRPEWATHLVWFNR